MEEYREFIITVILIVLVLVVGGGSAWQLVESAEVRRSVAETNDEIEQTLDNLKTKYGLDADSLVARPGVIFEEDGMLCANFEARNYDMRKAMGTTCLTRMGEFHTIAPVVMHVENQSELVAIQAKIRREKITRGGW